MKDLTAQTDLQRQNRRLQLLLDLTNRITSNLDVWEVVRAVSANLREVMLGDLVGIGLPDEASGKLRIYALDLPESVGILREGMQGQKELRSRLSSLPSQTPQILTTSAPRYRHSMRFSRNRRPFAIFRL
jgi:hypothetical protein